MGFTKPFKRNYRPVNPELPNAGWSDWAYLKDPDYCQNPIHYIRAFEIIQDDLLKLFEYIEPSNVNESAYSFRTHELLIRVCIEVEANFKAILKENIYNPTYSSGHRAGQSRDERTWNMNDYKIINQTHKLSDYSIEYPIWNGTQSIRHPFLNWNNDDGSIEWYQIYNRAKHDRINSFSEASFSILLDAFAGLAVLLSSQFKTEDFSPGPDLLAAGPSDIGIGGYLKVNFPTNWTDEEIYEFNWQLLKEENDRFAQIDYNNI